MLQMLLLLQVLLLLLMKLLLLMLLLLLVLVLLVHGKALWEDCGAVCIEPHWHGRCIHLFFQEDQQEVYMQSVPSRQAKSYDDINSMPNLMPQQSLLELDIESQRQQLPQHAAP